MKSSELNKLILANGWRVIRQNGSHVIYEKDGKIYPATFHGSKEVAKGLEKKIRKEMRLETVLIFFKLRFRSCFESLFGLIDLFYSSDSSLSSS